jgi:hypothetical protein
VNYTQILTLPEINKVLDGNNQKEHENIYEENKMKVLGEKPGLSEEENFIAPELNMRK